MKKIVSIIAAATLTCSLAACARTNRQRAQNNTNQYATDGTGINPGSAAGIDNRGTIPNGNPDLVGNGGNWDGNMGYNIGYNNRNNNGNNTGNQAGIQGNTPSQNYSMPLNMDEVQITDENVNGGIGLGNNQSAGLGLINNPNTGFGSYSNGSFANDRNERFDVSQIGGLGNSQVNTTGYTQGAPGTQQNQGNQGNAQGFAAGTYKDGTYTGQGDRGARATVTINGGRISDIALGRDANGTFIQDENLNLGTEAGGGATSNVGQTTRSLANAMIQAQSPDIVTSTTGDTTIVDDMKLAVRRALDQARR